MAAVEEVDGQPDRGPGKEAQPGQNRKTGHQQPAEQHAKHRSRDAARGAKSAVAAGIAVAQDDDADGYQSKGKQGADVRKIGERADVENSRRNADDEPGDPGCG